MFLDGIALVVDRARRAGEIVQSVRRREIGLRHVVVHHVKTWRVLEVRDVPSVSRREIVDAQDLVTLSEQPLAEVGAEESCTPCDNASEHALSYPAYTRLTSETRSTPVHGGATSVTVPREPIQ